jgi:hypothetical protein
MAPVRRLLGLAGRSPYPETFLVIFVAVVYRDALWGVPRSDQLVYLYEASQFDSPAELLAHSASWNRTISIGDHLLYRPFLYFLLAAEHILFGRTFVLWQAMGVALHAAQSLVLYRLLVRLAPGRPVAALAAAALFSSLLVSSEAVVWHHITGYILFTLLTSLSLWFLLDFLEGGRPRAAGTSVLLALGATFTYEFGAVYCLLAALGTAISAVRFSQRRREGGGRSASRRSGLQLRLATTLGLVPLLYAVVSATDLLARLGSVAASDAPRPTPTELLRGLALMPYPAFFWAGGVLLPSVYRFGADRRTMFLEFIWPTGPWLAFNLAAAGAAVAGAVGGALLARGQGATARLGRLALGYAFVLTYLAVLSLGRLLPRGAAYTLYNLHYAYIAILGVLVAHALGLWAGADATHEPRPAPPRRPRAAGIARWLLTGGTIGLALVNGAETASLLAAHRHVYAAPRLELLHHARRWHEQHAGKAFFDVSVWCPGNAPLPWFRGYLRHRTPMPYFLDTLYPATSWNLHREAIGDGKAPVLELSCTDPSARADDLLGPWETGAGPAEVLRAEGESVALVSQTGALSGGTVRGGVVAARQWRVSGTISHDRQYIFWENGAIWRRR